jgi:flagellar biogenesis protein FliO
MSRAYFSLVIAASLVSGTILRGGESELPFSSSQTKQGEQIPLRPPGATSAVATPETTSSPTVGQSLTTVVGGLAVCLGIFFLLVWLSKRHAPGALAPLPKDVVHSLGRFALNSRQQLQLLRVGRKLLLLNVTPTGVQTVTEISDSTEVDRIVGLCQQTSSNSVTASFRDVLTHFESEPAHGFLGDASASDWELAARGGKKRPGQREDFDD